MCIGRGILLLALLLFGSQPSSCNLALPMHESQGVEAVMYQALSSPALSKCCVSVVAKRGDAFVDSVLQWLLETLTMDQRLVQVFSLSAGQLPSAPEAWINHGCNVYVLLAEDVSSFTKAINTDDKLWNFEGTYLLVTCSHTDELEDLAGAYKMQKTINSLMIQVVEERQQVAVYTHQLYTVGKKLQFLYRWTHITRPWHGILFPDKAKDLAGFPLTVYAFKFEPSVLADESSNGSLYNVSGVEGKMVHALARVLNFTPVFRHPGPLRWGGVYDNGTTYELVHDDEGEIGVGDYYISLRRFQVITFSAAYGFDSNCFLTPVPKERPRWLAIALPFTLPLWALLTAVIVALCLLVPSLVIIFDKVENPLYSTLTGSLVLMMAIFTRQPFVEPRDGKMRLVAGAVMMGGLLITMYYSTNLTAYMTVPSYEQPLRSIGQLLETNMRVGCITDNWRLEFLLSDNNEVCELAQRYSNLESFPEHLHEVVDGKMVFFTVVKVLRRLMSSLPENQVRIMEQCPYTYNVGALLKRNTPLKDRIDMAILRMQAGGLLNKFLEKALGKLRVQAKNTCNSQDTSSVRLQVLTIEHVQGAFLVLGLGVVLSLLMFLGEVCLGAHQRRKKLSLRQTIEN